MTKTKKNVTSMITTEETKEFKKRRMKEVRTMVARAHKQGKRVDQMGFEGTDIPRAIIALQDLLAKSEERHHKATKHIALANKNKENMNFILGYNSETIMEQQAHISKLTIDLYNEMISHNETASMLKQTHGDLTAVKRAQEFLNG